MKLPSVCFAAGVLFLAPASRASGLVVDSFVEGTFDLSWDEQWSAVNGEFPGPIGTDRYAAVTVRGMVEGSVLTSTLSTVEGTLSFLASGSNTLGRPLELDLTYSRGGPYDISGYSAFEFDFASVEGEGELIIDFGNGSAANSPSSLRVPFAEAGLLTVPVEMINLSSHSLDAFYGVHFVFQATSPTFGFTLNEIRLVPEPATWALLLGASALGLAMVRRHRRSGAG